MEKWFIKRNEENHQEINKWFKNRIGKNYNNSKGILLYPPNNGWSSIHPKKDKLHWLLEGYTEITFEEFQKITLVIEK